MTQLPDDVEVADLADEYELLGELGRGASAVVYRARDRALGRLVAIKVVRAHSIAGADDAMRRLAREARTVARLQHPHIVTVYAVRRLQTGGLALVMQLVPGRTLKQAITEHGPFAPEQAEQVMRDVAEALAYAHSRGVVHRDVKPENIFLDADSGRALLSDFGIAHTNDNESRLTMTGAAIGTPAYMAPEQIDGAPADARSDLYSFGLVTWEMLTGRAPVGRRVAVQRDLEAEAGRAAGDRRAATGCGAAAPAVHRGTTAAEEGGRALAECREGARAAGRLGRADRLAAVGSGAPASARGGPGGAAGGQGKGGLRAARQLGHRAFPPAGVGACRWHTDGSRDGRPDAARGARQRRRGRRRGGRGPGRGG